MHHQLIKESLYKFLTLKKILKNLSQELFFRDIILCLKKTIRVLVVLSISKVKYLQPNNCLWLVTPMLLSSNTSSINKLLSQNKRKITLNNNKNQRKMIKIKKSENYECLKV